MDYQDISQKELARDSGVDQSTISKYLSGKNDCRNRKTLVALCCGLKIETSISDMFFKKCGLSLDESGEDGLLRYILTNMLENTPKERNEFLKSYGFKPLTSEDYDKFDYDDLDS
jgi:transcriptional regulator with XRE-family HTH domain